MQVGEKSAKRGASGRHEELKLRQSSRPIFMSVLRIVID